MQVEVPPLHDRPVIDRIAGELVDAAARLGYPQAAQFALRLAVEEAVRNACRHGHAGIPDTPVLVRWEASAREIAIEIEDRGPGFNPEAVPDPTLEENLDKPSGRGLMLMRAYMTEVAYNDRGNVCRMCYRNPEPSR